MTTSKSCSDEARVKSNLFAWTEGKSLKRFNEDNTCLLHSQCVRCISNKWFKEELSSLVINKIRSKIEELKTMLFPVSQYERQAPLPETLSLAQLSPMMSLQLYVKFLSDIEEDILSVCDNYIFSFDLNIISVDLEKFTIEITGNKNSMSAIYKILYEFSEDAIRKILKSQLEILDRYSRILNYYLSQISILCNCRKKQKIFDH